MNRHSHSVLKIKHKTPQHHKTDQYDLCVILHLLILAIHFLEERVLYRQYIASKSTKYPIFIAVTNFYS